MLTCGDWFNVCSSGGNLHHIDLRLFFGGIRVAFITSRPLIATVQDDGMIENFVFSINET